MNMSDLMKQAQQFQEKLATVQNDLGGQQVVGSAGAGMVTATGTCVGRCFGFF